MVKIKESFQGMKGKLTALAVALVLSVFSVSSVFAADEQGVVKEAVTSGITVIASDVAAIAAMVIPIGIGIFALFFVVKFGLKFFKQVTG